LRPSFLYNALANIARGDDIDVEFEQLLITLHTPKIIRYLVASPLIIYLQMERVKIIDVEFFDSFDNLLKFANKSFDYIYHIPEVIQNNFLKQDMVISKIKHNSMCCSFINAIDQEVVLSEFNKNFKIALGFLKLSTYGYLNLNNHVLSNSNYVFFYDGGHGFRSSTEGEINKAIIDQNHYNYLLNIGLDWLNDTLKHSDKIKAIKVKDALYWYSLLSDEKDLTLKLVYSATVLEILMKNKDHTTEVQTTIAERVAFLLGDNYSSRVNYYSKIKEFYQLRSKVIHQGHILSINNYILVEDISLLVGIVLLKVIKKLADISYSFGEFIQDFEKIKFGDSIGMLVNNIE